MPSSDRVAFTFARDWNHAGVTYTRGDGNATESVQCRFQVVYTEKFGDPNATK